MRVGLPRQTENQAHNWYGARRSGSILLASWRERVGWISRGSDYADVQAAAAACRQPTAGTGSKQSPAFGFWLRSAPLKSANGAFVLEQRTKAEGPEQARP
jgi:hypothetical protein